MEDDAKQRAAGDAHAPSGPACSIASYPHLGLEWRSYEGLLQPFAAHSHDAYVIGVVRAGRRSMVCAGHASSIGAEDMLVFNPGDVHACEQCDETPFAYESLHIEARLLEGARFAGPVIRDAQALRAFEALAAGMRAGVGSDAIEGMLARLASTLPSAPASPVPSEHASHAQAHLRAHASTRPSLDEIAAEEGISKYALIRAYQKEYAITPAAHAASFRVEHARGLIAQGARIADAAERAGFADQAHLTRVFKQQMGITPRAYQRMVWPPDASAGDEPA